MADLNYHHLRYFRVVAHEGHLTRAAKALNVSQSALSSQIRLLEDRLGQKLFERRGRALHLTEAGRIALDHADAIFSTGEELVATLKQTGAVRQVIRIGANATLSRNFQIAFLTPLMRRPDVEIVLRSGSGAEIYNALASHHLDVVLTNQPPAPDALSGFIVQEIDRQPVGLIGVPGLCKAGVTLERALAELPLILPTASGSLRMAIDALCDRLAIRPQIAAEADDMAMIRLLAREGIGLAAIPPIVVRDELDSGVLQEAHPLPGISETFYAVTTRRRFPNPVLQDLLKSAG